MEYQGYNYYEDWEEAEAFGTDDFVSHEPYLDDKDGRFQDGVNYEEFYQSYDEIDEEYPMRNYQERDEDEVGSVPEDDRELYYDENTSLRHGWTERRKVQVTFDNDPRSRRIYYVNCLTDFKVSGYFYNEEDDTVYPEYGETLEEDEPAAEESGGCEESEEFQNKEEEGYVSRWERSEAKRLEDIRRRDKEYEIEKSQGNQVRQKIIDKENDGTEDIFINNLRLLRQDMAKFEKIVQQIKEENMAHKKNKEEREIMMLKVDLEERDGIESSERKKATDENKRGIMCSVAVYKRDENEVSYIINPDVAKQWVALIAKAQESDTVLCDTVQEDKHLPMEQGIIKMKIAEQEKIIVPEECIGELVQRIHIWMAHAGERIMDDFITRYFCGFKIKRIVRQIIVCCEICKRNNDTRGELFQKEIQYPITEGEYNIGINVIRLTARKGSMKFISIIINLNDGYSKLYLSDGMNVHLMKNLQTLLDIVRFSTPASTMPALSCCVPGGDARPAPIRDSSLYSFASQHRLSIWSSLRTTRPRDSLRPSAAS